MDIPKEKVSCEVAISFYLKRTKNSDAWIDIVSGIEKFVYPKLRWSRMTFAQTAEARGLPLHQDNEPVQTAATTVYFLASTGVQILLHPPHSLA
ncbi:hypothetical protein EVAR_94143_1 [Eumeta japonica]|uniref:Uncharacterized protein n=1 Tax=Eumeta variegata TaxID=151549 RepID=A0A4C1U6T4_EUMVA|nr:hypothetical protein EVAR_94143_1 [Eumeta japonica]